MVAVLLAQGCGVVTAALLDLHNLRRARFAAHAVSQSAADAVCRTARFQDFLHRLFDVFEVVLFERDFVFGIGIDTRDFAFVEIQQFFHQMRLINHAVIGERSGGVCHLQRGVSVVTLPDADRDHLACAPFFGSRIG